LIIIILLLDFKASSIITFALVGVFTNKQLMIYLFFFLLLIAGKKTPAMAKFLFLQTLNQLFPPTNIPLIYIPKKNPARVRSRIFFGDA